MTRQNRETLEALADRAEKATGSDRELDALIWCTLLGVKYKGHGKPYATYGGENPLTQVEFVEPPRRTRVVSDGRRIPHAKPCSSSLDAAMSLVPEGLAWTVGQNVHHRHWVASLNYLDEDGAPQSMAGSNAARSPALALVAAALRARATLDPTGEKA